MHDDERPLTGEESIAIITGMINKAKQDYNETGVSCLLWGSIVTICNLTTFAAIKLNAGWLAYVWYLTIVAIAGQVYISVRESKRRAFKTHQDAAMDGIWISYGIALCLFSFYSSKFEIPHANAVYLTVYGIPTFATGIARRFRPMVVGGIACWVLAIVCMYALPPYTFIYGAIAAQLAWFIPGIILRKRYLKAKRGNV